MTCKKETTLGASKLSALLGAMRVLTTPSCWLQNHHYSKVWDAELRKLMMENKFEPIDCYRAKIGNRVVWIENHPYASMRPYGANMPRIRAKRSTILVAGDKLYADLIGT